MLKKLKIKFFNMSFTFGLKCMELRQILNPTESKESKKIVKIIYDDGSFKDVSHLNIQVYSTKRKREVSYCPICNTEICRKSKLCRKCNNLAVANAKKPRPSYEVLKKAVAEKGLAATGRYYNVSGNGVKKWIKQYEANGNKSTDDEETES